MTRVADVMTPGVETTTSSEALRDAARTMRKGDFGAMPVDPMCAAPLYNAI